MICPLASVEEVFTTSQGAVYQCSRKNCYWLEFQGNTTAFKVSDFFVFKRSVDQIDVEAMLNNSSRSFDFELIMPFRTERCFLLSVEDVLDLRDRSYGSMRICSCSPRIYSLYVVLFQSLNGES